MELRKMEKWEMERLVGDGVGVSVTLETLKLWQTYGVVCCYECLTIPTTVETKTNKN